MPTYEYVCRSCDTHLEVVQRFDDAALTECPSCGGALRKAFGNIGIVFKGSGFYKNDSRSVAKSGNGVAAKSGEGAKESATTGKKDGASASSSDGAATKATEGATSKESKPSKDAGAPSSSSKPATKTA
ncbi:MAG TPA: FmdB family zinc ribbon protein [Acidimicrobiales bacterium]|nr:FmdB family zinc ribbon protein [Acidimicrobiales bacterium]